MRQYTQNKHDTSEVINFFLNKWVIPKYPLTTNMTLILDIQSDLKDIYSKFSRNWKRSIPNQLKIK